MELSEFFAENGASFFWLFLAIGAAIVEGATCGLVSIWFVPGALAAMLLSLFVDAAWLQILVFLAVSVLTMVLTKTVFKKYLPQHRSAKTNADALIGTHGIVEEEIDNIRETGSVKLRGMVWTARSSDETVVIPAGTVITVCEISGVKLICKPRTESTPETKN
jgi:membrane protein implicated in regulation of membrane protease activity